MRSVRLSYRENVSTNIDYIRILTFKYIESDRTKPQIE
jgi:hypothetical protein